MTGICGLVTQQRIKDIDRSFSSMVQQLARYPHGSIQQHGPESGCALAAVRYKVSDMRGHERWNGCLGNWVFVGEARLDSRQIVAAALGYDSLHCSVTDEQLVCECLLSGDNALLATCFGDWIVAGVHKFSGELLIAREPYGSKTLYYHEDKGAFAFSSAMDSLLCLKSIKRDIDDIHVLRSMTRWPSKDFSTVYKGVYFLAPATILKHTERGVSLHRYWAMEDCIKPLKIGYQDAAQELLVHMKNAVACRLPATGQVGCMLSSGLDSSSITALSHERLSATSRQLHCYSLSPLFKDKAHASTMRIADESAIAGLFANQLPNTVFNSINASDITPIEGLRRTIMATCQPFYATSNDHWMHSLFARAAADGNHVLLNGGMGNLTFSWGFSRRTPAWRLLLAGKLRSLYHQQRQHNPIVNSVQRRLANRRTEDQPWTAYSIVNPQYARDIGLYSLMDAEWHDPSLYTNMQNSGLDERLDWVSPRSGVGVLWDMLARVNGLDVFDPTADTRLILFTLNLPEHIFTGPRIQGRWLAREAMRNYLPDSVRLRTIRGLQAADLNAKLLADSSCMEALLFELDNHEAAARMIDLPRMKAIWRAIQAESTIVNQTEAWSLLLNGLASGIFLTQVDNF